MVSPSTVTAPPVAASAWPVAAAVPDPELPQLTLADLGILRDVAPTENGGVVVTITPTYSGCPAMREIAADLRRHLERAGLGPVEVRTRLAPAWSSDWISEEGRRKLAEAGIAPPTGATRAGSGAPVPLTLGRPPAVTCPRCGSVDTSTTAAFGSTACKSLHRCRSCDEPFEAVKAI